MADSIYILERYEDLIGGAPSFSAATIAVCRFCHSRTEAEAYMSRRAEQDCGGRTCRGYVLRKVPLSSDLDGLPFVEVGTYLPDGTLYSELSPARLTKGPSVGDLVTVFPSGGGSVSTEIVVEAWASPPRFVTVDRNGSASSPPLVNVFPPGEDAEGSREMLEQAAGRYRPHRMAKGW